MSNKLEHLAELVAAGRLDLESAELTAAELRDRGQFGDREARGAISAVQRLLDGGRAGQAKILAAMGAIAADGSVPASEPAIEFHRLAGAAAYELGDLATAEEHLAKSVAGAEALSEDSLVRAQSFFEMAKLRNAQDRLQEAARFLGPAESTFVRLDRRDILSRSRLVYGLMLIKIGSFDKAQSVLEEGAAFADAIGDRSQNLNYQFGLADLAWRRENLDEAERRAQGLRQAADVLRAPASAAQVLVLLSMVAERRGRLEAADGLMAEAAERYRTLGDTRREASALGYQARFASLQKRDVDAEAILSHAIEVAGGGPPTAELGDLLLAHGKVLNGLGRREEALPLFGEAQRLFAAQGRQDKAAEAGRFAGSG